MSSQWRTPRGFEGYFGMARADITPPVGIYHRNWGASAHDTAEGIDQPLTLTVLTLQETPEAKPLVLAGADLGWWRDPKDEGELRSAVLEAFSLDPSRFLLNFSHTHAGPVLCRDDADKPGGEHIPPYLDKLRETVVATIREALSNRFAGTLDFAYGTCNLATHRDLPHPDGSGRYLCGWNPDVPADNTLLLGQVGDSAGVVRGVLLNYACHPTTLGAGNRLLSPDFVGSARQHMEPEKICLFLQGASGELAPRWQYSAEPTPVHAQGSELGYATQAAHARMLPPGQCMEITGVVESGAPLAIWEAKPYQLPATLDARLTEVELPLKPEWQSETEEERQWAASGEPALLERLRRRRRIRIALGGQPYAKIPLWTWRIGDTFLMATPTEAYSNLQTELRAAFPQTAIAVLDVTNGWWGYLPPADTYTTDRYSVWQTPFAQGSLEILIAEAKRAIEDLTH